MAIADFFNAPDIHAIDLSSYSGQIGDKITIQVADVAVKEVKVQIINADGTELEHGNAHCNESNAEWIYIATATNESLDGDKIIVKATDFPGNIGMKEVSTGGL